MTDFETKDSGHHEEYGSGMRRDSNAGKPRFDLIRTELQSYDEQMLTRYAKLLSRGAAKYEDRNWEKGDSEVELKRAKDSFARHIEQFLAGETDEDHAAAIWFNVQAIEYFKWRIAEKAKDGVNYTLSFDGTFDSKTFALLVGLPNGAQIYAPNAKISEDGSTIIGEQFPDADPIIDVNEDGTPFRKSDLAPKSGAHGAFQFVDGAWPESTGRLSEQTRRKVLDKRNDLIGKAFDAVFGSIDDKLEVEKELNRKFFHGSPEVSVTGEAQAVSSEVGGVTKKRVDDWLQYFNIDLLAGDLGDPHILISREEFSDRMNNTSGVRWQVWPRDFGLEDQGDSLVDRDRGSN